MTADQAWVTARSILPRGQTLPVEDWRRRQRVVVGLLAGQAVGLPLLGIALGSGLLRAASYGVLIGAITVVSWLRRASRDLRSSFAAVGLVVCSSVLVQITGGAIGAHVHVIVMVPIVALYEDWLPFGLAAGYVLVEHGLVGTLAAGARYDHAPAHDNPWLWAGLVTGFFVACVGALANWRFAERARLGGEPGQGGHLARPMPADGFEAYRQAAPASLSTDLSG